MRRAVLVCLLLILAIVAAYWPINHAGFLNFDDNQYVTNNPRVFLGFSPVSLKWAFTTFHASNWHPLTWLSHVLDCQIFGYRPAAHHWVNVGFHCANSCLLFLLLWRLTSCFARSAFVAALFALHPVHVESVAWISERKDVLSAFFFLLTLLAYATWVERRRDMGGREEAKAKAGVERWKFNLPSSIFYLLSVILFSLGLMAKPMLVTLPFLLLLLDYWPLNRMVRKRLWPLLLEKLPFFLLSLASCIMTFYSQKAGGAIVKMEDVPLEARWENAGIGFFFYLGKTFWPARLAAFYPYPDHLRPTEGIAAGIGLLLITLAVLKFAKRCPYFFTGWFWFTGMLVPVIGLVQVGSQIAADRYTYLPLIGIFIAISWGTSDLFSRWQWKWRVLAPASFATVAVCGVLTFQQVKYWRDSVTLFSHALQISPYGNPIVEHNLGHALALSGDQPAAIAHFKEALRYRPDFSGAHLNWGNSVALQGNVAEAIQHYQDAIRYQPSYEEAHYQLGQAYAIQGKLDLAEASLREAIRWKPDYAEAYVKLGNTLDLKGDVAQARTNWYAALKCQPMYDEPHFYLAGSFAREKKFPEAIAQFREALKLNPKYPSALNDLAWILATQPDTKLRNVPEAVRMSEKACQLTNRTNAMYLDTLAVVFSQAGRFPEAVSAASNALAVAESSGQSVVAPELQKHLELFKAGKPYREITQGH